MTEVEQPSQNGIDLTLEEDANNKARPADIEQDMREMERRKRVEAIMGSKLFREELERIVDSQIREGGSSGILQQLSDIVGIPTSRVGNVFKSSNCVLPINDIRGVESMGYSKGEKILRCKLGASFRLLDVYGWSNGLGAQITARLKVDQELFLVNPYGLLFHEVTASSLNKVDMQGNVVEQGTTNFGVNKSHFMLHSVVHAARPDIRCAIYIGCNPVVAISSLRVGLLPLTYDSVVLGEISTHQYTGCLSDSEEREKLVRNLGPVSKVMLLTNHGALCCGETIEEAFFTAHHIVQACETQLKLLPIGVDNLVMIPDESRKAIYDASRRPPEDIAAFEKKTVLGATASEDASTADASQTENNKDTNHKMLQQPKWRVGGAEFEALMRMLDNAGFRTGYIYRHPLIKSELPKPKNDVELPPAVSSLGYLLEEEELYRQGIWKKGDWRKGGDRSRWLNSPNVYQKVEVLETGTPDPKKITKWVADGSPTHSTPVRIEGALQFVPTGTNSKEFKKVQQQIKDNRRADKISAGPQSHILEGVTWDEANRIKDATVSSAGDHVVLMGAASKGIIQRGFQHNATVYKAPYAKNPFDNVTDDELNEYKRTVEKKKNIHGEYTDTDFSESEALSSLQTSGAQQQNSSKIAVVSQSENEDASDHQVIRIETKQAPVPSQPEIVLSDAQENRITTCPINSPTVTFTQENFIGQECCKILDYSSYHLPLTKYLLSEKKISKHQKTHLKSNFPSHLQPEIFSLNSEIPSSETLSIEKKKSKFFTPRAGQSICQSFNYDSDNVTIFKTSLDCNNSLENFLRKPFRTHSHFGYNYSRYENTPKHFHFPISPSKYTGVKKPFSFNEIFSSPRAPGWESHNSCESLNKMSLNDGSVADYTDERNNNEFLQSLKNLFDVSGVLESVPEIDEDDQSQFSFTELSFKSNASTVSESLNFSDKITRMNYSEESSSLCFKPSKLIAPEITVENNVENLSKEISTISTQSSNKTNKEVFILDTNSSSDMKSNNSADRNRKLMTRQERNQRKYDFSELWEDHIQYYSNSSSQDNVSISEAEIYLGKTSIQSLESSASSYNHTAPPEHKNECQMAINQKQQLIGHNSFSDDEPSLSNSELTSIELQISEKIEMNDLKKQQIFNNIQNNFQQKITPSNVQEIILKKLSDNTNLTASTPKLCSFNMFKDEKVEHDINFKDKSLMNMSTQFNPQKLSHVPNLRNLSSVHQDFSCSKGTDNNNCSPNVKKISASKRQCNLGNKSLIGNKIESQQPLKHAKRNFVAENIRSAFTPRRFNNISKISKSVEFCSGSHSLQSAQNITSPVYSFQTITVGSSPRFWVTLSSMEKHNPTHLLKTKHTRKEGKQSIELASEVEPVDGSEFFENETIVDKEIKTLGQHIDAFKPRYDRYGRTIGCLEMEVSKAAELMDVVVETQNEIKASRQQLRKDIISHQCLEKICCDFQTFSIFESDD